METELPLRKKKKPKKNHPPSHPVVTGYVIRWEGECRESGHVCVWGLLLTVTWWEEANWRGDFPLTNSFP